MENKMRLIIVWTAIAFMVIGAIFIMKRASEFDYGFVNSCNAMGGRVTQMNDMKQCTKDGKMVIVD
jgi:hypothetical protein